jgi:hypothetical protein
MYAKDLIKKYNLNSAKILNEDSICIDFFIKLITLIELNDKFNIDYDKFNFLIVKLKEDYDELTKINSNLFSRKFWDKINTEYINLVKNDLFYEYNENKLVITNNHENTPNDCDFFIHYLDEFNFLLEKDYISDNKWTNVIDVDVFNELDIIKNYEEIKEVSEEKDYYLLTIAKNTGLFVINKELNKKPVKAYKEPEEKIINKQQENSKMIIYQPPSEIALIKEMLIENLKNIKDGNMPVVNANAFNNTVQTFINMSKAELEFCKFSNMINKL